MTARQRGATLFELLTVALITVILLAVYLPAISEIYGADATISNAPLVQSNATDMANRISESIASAPKVGGTALASASNADVTVYSSGTGASIRYYINGGVLKVVTSNQTTNLYAGASLSLTYYKSTSYNSSALVVFQPVSATQLSQVVAVAVVCSLTTNGYTSTCSDIVHLRNGPAKSVSFS